MRFLTLSIMTGIVLSSFSCGASQGRPVKISENNIKEAIGILNTANGGLFPLGAPGTTNAFTQYKDQESINRWNNRLDEVRVAEEKLASSFLVKGKTQQFLLDEFRELKSITNYLIEVCNIIFLKNIQPLLPEDLRKGGSGKISELPLGKLDFKGMDLFLGDRINVSLRKIIGIKQSLADKKKERTNAPTTNKALQLLWGLCEIEQSQVITCLMSYIDLLFGVLVSTRKDPDTKQEYVHVRVDPVLTNIWNTRLDELRKNIILLDKRYQGLADTSVKEHYKVIDAVNYKAKAGKFTKKDTAPMQKSAAVLLTLPSVCEETDKALPPYAEPLKLGSASRDAIVLIKKLNSLLKNWGDVLKSTLVYEENN